MKRLMSMAMVLAMALGLGVGFAWAEEEDEPVKLKEGDAAPGFELIGSDGATYTLEQFKGKQPVVLAFFPKAFTPG